MRRADDLGGRAHRIGILDLDLQLARHQIAAVDELVERVGSADSARKAAHLVQAHVVGLHVGQEGFERHRAGNLGLLEPAVHVVQLQGAHGRQQVCAVDGRQPIPRLEAGDRDAGTVHGHLAGQALALVKGLALAHEQQRDLRHGCQVATGPH